jgi:hypothetical protein
MAARKKVDPLKAKEAKQKKIAIGGMVLLCLLGAVQGPKTLKMLKGPQATAPAAAPAPTTPAPGTTTPTTTTTGPGTEAAPTGGAADLATVGDSDVAPEAEEGQLVTFERFASKDPFAPQAVVTPDAAPAPADGGDAAGADGGAPAEDPEPSPVDGGFTPAPGESGSAGGGSPTPAAPALAQLTSISVNGTAEDVEVEATFPAAEPTFVLVSLAKNGTSVEIGVAGGSYANGEQTIKLERGKPLTLQNTADGTRYELELLAVAGFPTPK